jgi:hypothetical protein
VHEDVLLGDDDPHELEARVGGGLASLRRPALHGAGLLAFVLFAGRLALAQDGAYRPADVVVTNPAYDGFPSNGHNEPSIAAQGDVVVCVFNDRGDDVGSPNPAVSPNVDGFSLSTNGGTSFVDHGKRAPIDSLDSFNGDNVVAAGPDGDFFYVSDGSERQGFRNSISVSRSTDGGKSWSAPSDAAAGVPHLFPDGFFDKPWLAVDTSTSPSRGHVYVTWSDFSFTGFSTALWVARSTDRGVSWSAHRLDSFPFPVAVTYVQVAANGTVWVGEQNEGVVVDGRITGTNFLRASTDGGGTWSTPKVVGSYFTVGDATAQALCGDPTFFGGLVRYLNGPIEADSSLRIAVDPGDPSGKTVWVVTHAVPLDRPGDGADVFLWRTTDGGATFFPPIRVNDDATENDQFMPDLWAAPDGTLGVMWLDRRNDPANWRLEAWMAISHDHGASFGPSFPVSSAPFPPVGTCQMSDYNGVFADARRFFLAWGDAREVDPVGQLAQQIRAATVPLEGPGPLLTLESFTVSPDRRSLHIRVRNDGTESVSPLIATVSIEGNTLPPPPIAVVFLPAVPPAHGTSEVDLFLYYEVPTPFLKGTVTLLGAAGSTSFPIAFSKTPGADLGRRLSADFETPSSIFVPLPGSLWRVTEECAALDHGHSGSKVAYFGLVSSCNYDAQVEAAPIPVFGGLVSRAVFLPKGAALLRFNEWVGLPARYRSDHAGVQISTDGGTSFENLWGYGRMSRFTPPLSLALTGADGRPTWHPVELDLSDYTGHEVALRFWFNGTGKPFPGYAIDDVELYAMSEGPEASPGTCAAPQPLRASQPVLVNIVGSVSTGNEPAPSCPPPPGSHAFWLELVPEVSGRYLIEAETSAFAAAVSVFTGPRCGPWQNVGGGCCADGVVCIASYGSALVDARAGEPLHVLLESIDGRAGNVSMTATLESPFGELLVPIVLDVISSHAAYRTELALTNHAAVDETLTLGYTPSLGAREGGGSVTETLGAGRQLLIPDTLAYLRGKGLAIPPSSAGQQGGTLRISYADDGTNPIGVLARTVSPTAPPQPEGLASVAYPAARPDDLSGSTLLVPALRSSADERSKVAVYAADAPVTVRMTAFSGSDGARRVVAEEALPPWGWKQMEDVLGADANGWVVVERIAGGGKFGAYGVVNDDATNDGSFIAGSRSSLVHLVIPIVLETPRFTTELVLTNTSSEPMTVSFHYRESLGGAGAEHDVETTIPPLRQLLYPDALDFLRSLGVPVGDKGPSYGGALAIDVGQEGFYASARTTSPSPAGGRFGLFTPAAPADLPSGPVFLDGLRADETTRSNVAVVNAGGGERTFTLQVYDGDTGQARGAPLSLTLPGYGWAQPYRFFGASGARNGYVLVTSDAAGSAWLAYGVVNDGATPGQRTDDGAYVAASK